MADETLNPQVNPTPPSEGVSSGVGGQAGEAQAIAGGVGEIGKRILGKDQGQTPEQKKEAEKKTGEAVVAAGKAFAPTRPAAEIVEKIPGAKGKVGKSFLSKIKPFRETPLGRAISRVRGGVPRGAEAEEAGEAQAPEEGAAPPPQAKKAAVAEAIGEELKKKAKKKIILMLLPYLPFIVAGLAIAFIVFIIVLAVIGEVQKHGIAGSTNFDTPTEADKTAVLGISVIEMLLAKLPMN